MRFRALFLLSGVMQAVFLIIGKWNYTVLLGNLLSSTVSVINFLLMGLTVQKAVGKEEKEAKQVMKASQSLRLILIFLVALIGVLAPYFSTGATLIPLFFPRIAVSFRPLFFEKGEK